MSFGPSALLAVAVAVLVGPFRLRSALPAPSPVLLSPSPVLAELKGLRLDLLAHAGGAAVPAGSQALVCPSCQTAPPCACPIWSGPSFGWGVLCGLLAFIALRLFYSCVKLVQIVDAAPLPAPRIAGQVLRLT